jgi:DNA-binding CsgD family transcriptional regulator
MVRCDRVGENDDSDAGARVPCIEVLEGRKRGLVVPLEHPRSYVIGRLPGAEIHIDDPGVSRRHVKLTRRPQGEIEVVDMRSTNGLIVNGQKLERARLDEGDLLTLGPDAVLRLSYRAPDDLASAPMFPAVPAPAPEPSGSVEPTLRSDESTAVIAHRPAPVDPKRSAAPVNLPLSARQLEVSRLVANGLTNAAIAEALGISPRTVTSHLDHIYGRLGIGSRSALTRWIVERGLADPLD